MQYSASNPLVQNYIFSPHLVIVITVLWAELWFVVVRCNLTKSVGIVHISVSMYSTTANITIDPTLQKLS